MSLPLWSSSVGKEPHVKARAAVTDAVRESDFKNVSLGNKANLSKYLCCILLQVILITLELGNYCGNIQT